MDWKEDKPQYTHDCKNCQFLGSCVPNFNDGKFGDLYICVHENDASIICRYSDDGPDYWSADLGMALRFINDSFHDYVRIAIKRAMEDGIITPEIAFDAFKSI